MFVSRIPLTALGALFAAAALVGACGDTPLPTTGTVSTEFVDSQLLGQTLELTIRTPPDFDPALTYPLVFQLDAHFPGDQFDITAGFVSDYAAAGAWPEAIVVGLDFQGGKPGRFDYFSPPVPADPQFDSGEAADLFYRVMAEELLPHVESKLPIDPEQRILMGHSLGAVFAWYTAFRHTPPERPLFAAIVAADGGIVEELLAMERWHAERADDLPMTIYATRATANGAGLAIAFGALIDRLSARGYPSLVLETGVLETDHGGALWPSYETGLTLALEEVTR